VKHARAFLVLALALFAFAGWDGYRAREAARARDWPTVQGTVTGHATDRVSRRRKSDVFEPVIQYSYAVDGREYSGETFAFQRVPQLRTSDEALAFAQANYPQGSPCTVHYDPQSPSDAVLQTGEPDWTKASILGGIGAASLVVASVIFLISRPRG
jgi:hypothetical protein